MTDNGNPLSEREMEIMELVATGASNQEIARDLIISPNTVKVHLRNIFEKLQVQSRTEASMMAIQQGWLQVGLQSVETIPAQSEVPPRPAPRPIALWKGLYLAVAFFVALGLFILAQVNTSPLLARQGSFFSDVNLASVQPASPLPADRWARRASMPTARSRMAVAMVDGKVYAIAGETGDGPTGIVEVYDPQSNGWLLGPLKPTATANVAAATIEGRIYVPGGMLAGNTLTTTVEVLDPSSATWTTTAPLPTPLCCYALAAHEGRLYLFGGWDGETFVNMVWRYSPQEDVWMEETPMPTARGFQSAATVEGSIYIVGGYDGRRELAVNEVFTPGDTDKGEWKSRSPMTTPRGGLGLAATDAVLVAVGGGWTQPLTTNERYDVQKDEWTSIESPFLGQWRHLGIAAIDGRVLAIGGLSGAPMASTQEYQATFRVIVPISG